MRILVSGLGGHMGAEVAKLCRAGCRGAELTAGVDAMNWQSITDVPCAPENAIEEVKAVCAHTLTSHNASPIADLIYRIIDAN